VHFLRRLPDIESASPDSHRLRNAAQQSAVAVFRVMRFLTFGRTFPKPLLALIARRIPSEE
jgi:hypothetical protein